LKILAILSETGAGAYAAAPMIKAAAANGSIRDFKEITAYLRSLPLSGEDALKLKEMLKEGAWKTRSLALDALSGMSKKAEKAVPEIIALMKSSAEAEKYEKAFDSLAMINPEIAFTALVSDLKNPDSAIRKNAMNKLVEMQAYLSDKLGVKKEIVPALIRVLYGADEALSRLAQDALSRIEDPDARQAMENYIKIGKRAMELFYGLAGKTAQEVFKLQEQAVEKKLNNYYRQIGREDAAGK
ncbi:MAG TPA: hypothetical protein P5511_01540, partial [Candidatus Goldiibacteriota bacterium]|nr:hypothetical protein [Candidatus Goldiibacteriota bacterium]